MQYRRMGQSGLKLSELSFGSWITFGEQLDREHVRSLMHQAFDEGVNFFDNAEVYGGGVAEALMGEVVRDFRREDLVISTKLFWGGSGPNDTGLSRKHLLEGTKNSLKRLRLDYVDLLFCHRPDPDVPMEEVVLAMDYLVRQGYVLYWGTSEWSAWQLEEAFKVAERWRAIAPSVEQPEYNLLRRDRVERELEPLYSKYGLGTTTWSPLASGLLSGKYRIQGAPASARLMRHPQFAGRLTEENLRKVEALGAIASGLGMTTAQFAIAWCLVCPHVSSVILGASDARQLSENLAATYLKDKITSEVMDKVDELFTQGVRA